MSSMYWPIFTDPTLQQTQYWMNRIICADHRTKSEKWTTSIRKFHDMCAEDMIENIQYSTSTTQMTPFIEKVEKDIVDEILHLTQRLLSAQKLLADNDNIAIADNGVSLHVELEQEYNKFFERVYAGNTVPRRQKKMLVKHQSYVQNYFFHFHHIRVPIVPGEKEKYWEEYEFEWSEEEERSQQWRIGEAKRKRGDNDDTSSEGESAESSPGASSNQAKLPKKKSAKKAP